MIKVGDTYRYSGCIHLHTTHSDGSKPLQQIIPIAQREGLDFLLVTDHMTLAAKTDGLEGWHDSLLVGVGYEHNDPSDTHHYLIFGTERTYPPSMSAAEYVAAAARDGALGIVAHPDEVRTNRKYPAYPWRDWTVRGVTGIEIWNQMSEWTERLNSWKILPAGLFQPWSLQRPPQATLERWDELAKVAPVVGIAGADAHAFRVLFGPVTLHVFPYRRHFRALRTVVHLAEPLSPDGATARAQLYQAITARRVWFGNRLLGDFEEAEVAFSSGQTAGIGNSFSVGDNVALNVSLQLPGSGTSIRLIRDGACISTSHGPRTRFTLREPGTYRVDAWVRSGLSRRAAFFTNHMTLRP